MTDKDKKELIEELEKKFKKNEKYRQQSMDAARTCNSGNYYL